MLRFIMQKRVMRNFVKFLSHETILNIFSNLIFQLRKKYLSLDLKKVVFIYLFFPPKLRRWHQCAVLHHLFVVIFVQSHFSPIRKSENTSKIKAFSQKYVFLKSDEVSLKVFNIYPYFTYLFICLFYVKISSFL